MVPGTFKPGRMKHFPAGETAFFAHEVPAFHNIEGKLTNGSVNYKWCKSFGHVTKFQIINTPNVFV
jgi:hypothetical protein